jgi:hypothetical protein
MKHLDVQLSGGFRAGEMQCITGTSRRRLTVKSISDFFIIYERFDKSLDSVRRYIQDFNEELLEPVHTWKTQSRFKQRPKKKVVKLHPILAGFTKQGKR